MQIKTSLSIYLIIILSIIGGIWNAQYINDGYHWGFIFSNSIEFLNGKKPFEEIFIEYGFLHILINSFIISIFGYSSPRYNLKAFSSASISECGDLFK